MQTCSPTKTPVSLGQIVLHTVSSPHFPIRKSVPSAPEFLPPPSLMPFIPFEEVSPFPYDDDLSSINPPPQNLLLHELLLKMIKMVTLNYVATPHHSVSPGGEPYITLPLIATSLWRRLLPPELLCLCENAASF